MSKKSNISELDIIFNFLIKNFSVVSDWNNISDLLVNQYYNASLGKAELNSKITRDLNFNNMYNLDQYAMTEFYKHFISIDRDSAFKNTIIYHLYLRSYNVETNNNNLKLTVEKYNKHINTMSFDEKAAYIINMLNFEQRLMFEYGAIVNNHGKYIYLFESKSCTIDAWQRQDPISLWNQHPNTCEAFGFECLFLPTRHHWWVDSIQNR